MTFNVFYNQLSGLLRGLGSSQVPLYFLILASVLNVVLDLIFVAVLKGGVAGAAGLALSEDGRTLYVSDLGNRCVWAVDADARELTAGGKNCGSFVSSLPGYPGALALDEDGTLYISYRWTRSGWLEKHADSTLLRGIALRAGENIQKKLFKLPADAPCAEAVDTADGSWKQTFSGRELDGCTAVCPAGSKVYFGAAGSASLLSARV